MTLVKSKQKTKKHESKLISKHLIGTLGEKSLHSALKDWHAEPGDRLEVEVDGFHIDIVRRKILIEIQTSNFSSQRKKLKTLTEKHRVRLVFPIANEKWIVRLSADGVKRLGRRKSPKKGHLFHLFEELVSIPGLIRNENFSLEVLLIYTGITRGRKLVVIAGTRKALAIGVRNDKTEQRYTYLRYRLS